MDSRGKMIIIVAPSGTGKSTLIKRLKEEFLDLEWSVSFTTRKRRAGEIEGVHYFYISRKNFLLKREEGDFIEWAEVHGNFYGTSKNFVESKLEKGNDLLFDLDIQGADKMREIYGDEARIIFISPPDIKTLEKRLRGRATDDDNVIKLRLSNAQKELERCHDYNYLIINNELEKAFLDLRIIVESILRESLRD